MTDSQHSFAVIGGTGKVGRRVTTALARRGAVARPLGRSTNPGFDWADPGTWRPALVGTTGAFVAFAPEVTVPGADRQVAAVGEVIAGLGIERAVLLSARGDDAAAAAEAAFRAQVPTATVLRSSFFMQNFNEGFFAEELAHGGFSLPVTDAREPFVDAADLAEAAATTLLEAGHAGRSYELTGPESLTLHEAAALLSRPDRPVAFWPQSPQAYHAALVAAGLPDAEASEYTELFVAILDGRNAHVSDDLPRLLGRAPHGFGDFVAREDVAVSPEGATG